MDHLREPGEVGLPLEYLESWGKYLLQFYIRTNILIKNVLKNSRAHVRLWFTSEDLE